MKNDDYVELIAEHGQFALVEDGDVAEPAVCRNGLAAGLDVGIVGIYTGVESGPVCAAVVLLASAPQHVDSSYRWEDVVEVDALIAGGKPLGLAGFDLVMVVKPSASLVGRVRVRVHCLGRDDNYDLAVDAATERYLIQVWPTARPGVEETLRQTDRVGEWLRRSLAGD